MDYTSLVLITCLTVVGTGEAKGVVTGKKPTMRPVLAGFLLGVFLFIFGLASDSFGAKICYLVIVFALIANGLPLVQALTPKATPTQSPVGSGALPGLGGGGR